MASVAHPLGARAVVLQPLRRCPTPDVGFGVRRRGSASRQGLDIGGQWWCARGMGARMRDSASGSGRSPRRSTGTCSTTGRPSATSVRGHADSHEGQRAGHVSCGPLTATRSCPRLRTLQRVLHRSDRKEAAQPLPPGDAGVIVRHRRMQLTCKFSARTGTSPSPATSTRWRTQPCGHRRCGAPTGMPASSPTTIRSSSWRYAVDTALACCEAGIRRSG